MSADLHLHTTASDGSIRPGKVVEIASINKLKSIAITDHDTFDGLDEAIEASKHYSIEIIPGIELSCTVSGKDIHILAYWPDYKAKWLNDELSQARIDRAIRARMILDKLRDEGVDVSFEDVEIVAGSAAIGRSHIARSLVNKNFAKTIQDAFDSYIGEDAYCYIPKDPKKPENVLQMIEKAKGVAVLAHPGIAQIDEQIPELVKKGLKGIEVCHPDHDSNQEKKYKQIAKDNNLIPTAGSDFHAKSSHRGSIIGSHRVDDDVVESLRNASG